MILHSIKWRLQAWHGFLLMCLVAGLMSGFYVFERRVRLQAMDNELMEALTPLLPQLAPPGGRLPAERRPGERGPGDRGRPFPPSEFDQPPPMDEEPFDRPRPEFRGREVRPPSDARIYYVAWLPREERIVTSTNAPADVPLPQFSAREEGHLWRTLGENRELARLIPTGLRVVVGTSLAPTLAQLHKLAAALALIGCGIVVTGLAVGWWLATRALRPITEISAAAQEIAAGDLAKRINASETESELGQLATVLNSTFARLEAAFAQQRQFTSDAAHELRTPVAVILTQIQSTLNKDRSGPEYRETLEACQRAAQRMRRLIESLLELARLDAGQEILKQMPFDLAKTASDCVESIRPLAEQRQLKITTELAAAETVGDAERVAQVVTNLLSNAVQHTPQGSHIRIVTRSGVGAALLMVADNGPGIAPEDLSRIFDRFYRADAARTSAEGRSGLGLAISKAIVTAHGGTIEVGSEPGAGTTFTVSLPA